MGHSLRIVSCLLPPLCLLGCGGGTTTSVPPKESACTGISVTGVLHDSLTNLPVAKGWATLESAEPPIAASTISFSQPQAVTSDANGAFAVCATAIAQPAIVVIVAQDGSGNVYPPYIQQISKSTSLGTVLMGGCTITCGLDNQEQTSVPATITGEITSTPISIDGMVVAEYALKPLDGTNAIWNVAMPAVGTALSYSYSTVADGCSDQQLFCGAYEFHLPSQNAVTPIKGGYRQASGAPVYSILAQSADFPACSPSTISTYFESDGKSPLIASPGAHLSVQTMSFSGCH